MNGARCGSHRVMKNGHIHMNKPRWRYKDCNRQWVENPSKRVISEELHQTIDN